MTRSNGRIVVGDDGSEHGRAAVAWAATRAVEVGTELRVVNAAVVPVMAGLGWKVDAAFEAGRLLQAVEAGGHAHLLRLRRELEVEHPRLRVQTAVVLGDPREVLEAESGRADLLVVGARGIGPVQALLLGSVSAAVARHASCPTVVVRPPEPDARGILAVVRPADDPRALRFACSWAESRHEELVVVRDPDHDRGEDAERSAAWLATEMGFLRQRHPGVTVAVEDAPDHATDWLVEASHHRRLLVAERRTPHLRDRAVLLAEHARCPVAVVPAR